MTPEIDGFLAARLDVVKIVNADKRRRRAKRGLPPRKDAYRYIKLRVIQAACRLAGGDKADWVGFLSDITGHKRQYIEHQLVHAREPSKPVIREIVSALRAHICGVREYLYELERDMDEAIWLSEDMPDMSTNSRWQPQ